MIPIKGYATFHPLKHCWIGSGFMHFHYIGLLVYSIIISIIMSVLDTISNQLKCEIEKIKHSGLYKDERIIESSQNSQIIVNQKNVINFCANNYLGLANNNIIIKAAKDGLDKWGFGLSSVRFICGTQNIHKILENKISNFLETEDTILYTSCFDANGGLFETLLDKEDAIISDALNHASIIDGIRLCKAQRYRYANNNMDELESILQETQSCKTRMIATDGVFSMDGFVAQLDIICDLAEKYNALVMVDDSHATGFFGPKGRGSMIAFGIKGGRNAGEAFINNVKLSSHLANVGDTRTLVIHPASATHSQMDEATLKFAGLSQDMIRLSVGIEDINDIKNDFENGFRASQKPRLVSNQ